MEFSKTKHLEDVVYSHKMTHIQSIMDKALKKRDEIKDALKDKYGNKRPTRAINSGSYAKHTAINIKFDIDISQPFKHDSFTTLQEMADDVFNYFNTEYKEKDNQLTQVRKQTKSTGLTFDLEGDIICMDVVSGRELTQDDYVETNRLKLYVREENEQDATSTLTNIQNHTEHINGKSKERPVIRLLKVWKHNKGKKYIKSFFLELIVIRAFKNETTIPVDLWERLKKAMEFIRDNVETIKLEDPGNSNNIVSNDLTEQEKKNLSNDMKTMLERIEERSENIKIYFAVNEKYAPKEESNGNKSAAILGTSRFS
ncbi:hypothetical protein [Emticicia sp. W12TSBA100-4]|uniref:hypothetical protein n=1 Tax=Emticicia sp. W12TSBA100-4 TaxID=3160965 RepID=UPI00330654D0